VARRETCGLVGLGNMGGRIARRLAGGGFEVCGYDLDAAKAERSGARVARSVAEVVEGSEVVFLSLPDSRAVEEVVRGEGGILGACRAGQVVADLGTSAPSSTRSLHAELAGRGVELVDAAISGGAAGAEAGTLTIMAGGAASALERIRPHLETFSARVYHMGAPGAGHVAKILNNFLNGIGLAATSEVMVAARRAGLDLEQLLEVLNHSTGVNFATLNRFPSIVRGDYLEGGLTVKLMAKDVRLYLDLVRQLEVTTLAGPACLGAFDLAAALGYGDEISNRVVDALGDVSGGVRVHGGKEGT